MPQSEKIYRNACCRLHRVMANFFAVKAWCRGADCVILEREVLDQILNLDRMKGSRVKWMQQDMKQWFPYIKALNYDNKDSVATLYLSRINIDDIDDFMVGCMNSAERVKKMGKMGINTIRFATTKLSEDSMIAELSRLASGFEVKPEFKVKQKKFKVKRKKFKVTRKKFKVKQKKFKVKHKVKA